MHCTRGKKGAFKLPKTSKTGWSRVQGGVQGPASKYALHAEWECFGALQAHHAPARVRPCAGLPVQHMSGASRVALALALAL